LALDPCLPHSGDDSLCVLSTVVYNCVSGAPHVLHQLLGSVGDFGMAVGFGLVGIHCGGHDEESNDSVQKVSYQARLAIFTKATILLSWKSMRGLEKDEYAHPWKKGNHNLHSSQHHLYPSGKEAVTVNPVQSRLDINIWNRLHDNHNTDACVVEMRDEMLIVWKFVFSSERNLVRLQSGERVFERAESSYAWKFEKMTKMFTFCDLFT
jgi:hypothetical protein